MSYSSAKLAVRDSFDDDDVSDDVEDEVFIRDGRNGFKVDEERGVKRPLMAPRRKIKSNVHNEIGRRPPCRALCAPCCYGCIALIALMGLIVLVVSLVMWFPFSIDQVSKFWSVGQGAHFGDVVVPCTEITVEDIWTRSLSKLTVESAVRLNDVNGDGLMDIIIGYGTGADGHNVPDFVCTLYFGGITPCLGGVIALDGVTGDILWQHWTTHPVFMVDCSTDLTGDKTNDCLISGKGGVLKLLNGHDGSSVWHFVELDADSGIHGEPFVNVFSAQFVQDVDGDGLPDVLAAHTQDTPPGLSDNVLTGHLILISGKNGVFLQKVSTPRGEETYYAPQVLVHLDGESIVVFGTGGQASPGGLYAIPLHHLVKGNTLQIQELHRDEMKGIMSPPVLADLNQDGFEDIVAAMFDTMVVAFNGLTLQPLWNYTFPESETFSAPTPGYFNDDNIPDILVKYQKGPGFPVYYSSQTTVLDGKSGVPLLDKPIVDTTGSQMGGLSISVEGLGNDFLLYWTANCLNHEGPTKPYMYMPGSTVQAQSRTDLCQNLFNSTLYTQFIALSQHIEPPGIAVYSSEDRKSLEYNNSVNTSAQAHKYLGSHPDVLDMYDQGMMYNKVAPNEKKEFGDIPGTSSFRHRGDNSIAGNSDQGKDSNYFFNGDYLASKHRQNQISNDAGEQEEMLNSDFQGNSEFPNVRKHGGTHPLERTWQQEQQQADDSNVPLNYNNLIDNPVPNRDTDYDLYGPAVSAESLSSNNQGYVMDNQQNKGMMPRRIKREETPILHGLQRLTSLGTLIPSHWPSRKNDSVDLVFVTYWINPLTEAQVIVGKDKDCIERKQADLDVANGIDPEVIARDCLGYKWKKKDIDSEFDMFGLNMGQATVYRLRITCKCRSLANGEKCSSILPFSKQSWPGFMGHNGNGHFRPRHY